MLSGGCWLDVRIQIIIACDSEAERTCTPVANVQLFFSQEKMTTNWQNNPGGGYYPGQQGFHFNISSKSLALTKASSLCLVIYFSNYLEKHRDRKEMVNIAYLFASDTFHLSSMSRFF